MTLHATHGASLFWSHLTRPSESFRDGCAMGGWPNCPAGSEHRRSSLLNLQSDGKEQDLRLQQGAGRLRLALCPAWPLREAWAKGSNVMTCSGSRPLEWSPETWRTPKTLVKWLSFAVSSSVSGSFSMRRRGVLCLWPPVPHPPSMRLARGLAAPARHGAGAAAGQHDLCQQRGDRRRPVSRLGPGP